MGVFELGNPEGRGASSSFGNPGGSVGQKTQSRSQQEKNKARAVNKICCQVNTSRRGIKQLRISFGSIFLLQSNPAILKSQGKWKKVRNSGVLK